MKTITTIILSILLLSCISAIDVTAGETKSYLLQEEYVYYEVTGNQTEVDLNITKEGNNVTINFGKYINDSFTITFYNQKDDEIAVSQQQGGGGSNIYVCFENWECLDWSICLDGIQTRTCTDIANCGTTKNKPLMSQDCIVNEEENLEQLEISNEKTGSSGITGAVIGFTKSTKGIVSIILILGLAGVFIGIRKFRR